MYIQYVQREYSFSLVTYIITNYNDENKVLTLGKANFNDLYIN